MDGYLRVHKQRQKLLLELIELAREVYTTRGGPVPVPTRAADRQKRQRQLDRLERELIGGTS